MAGTSQPDGSFESLSSDDASPGRVPQQSKMILPRLEGRQHPPPAAAKRTPHACERCRTLKAKCTGGPMCHKCVADKAECRFGDSKRERNKKELASQLHKTNALTTQNEQLLTVLEKVSNDPDFNASRHPAVMQLLSKYPLDRRSEQATSPRLESTGSKDIGSMASGEAVTSAGIGSLSDMDTSGPPQSLGNGSGAAGYIGRSSEISWLRRAQGQMSSSSDLGWSPSLMDNEPKARGIELDYHTDEADLFAVDEESVNPMEMPPFQIASQLAESYFGTVHGSFPLIDREVFMNALNHSRRSPLTLSNGDRRWLSVANIIFAVGAKWMYLTRSPTADMHGLRMGPEDHVVYYARARSLGLDHRLVMDHPVIEQVQGCGILGLYLIVNHQISRAWTTIGHAMRHAIALGLHLRVTAKVGTGKALVCSRTWWSLYGLEQLLGDLTGRPTSITYEEIAAPLDVIVSAARARSGSSTPPFFADRIRLSMFAHRIRSALYAPDVIQHTWKNFQQKVWAFEEELTQWSEALPAEANLPSAMKAVSPDSWGSQHLDRLELAMFYQSIRMMLFRPFLCHLNGVIWDESEPSRIFNQEAAVSCVSAACSLLNLLPDNAAASYTSTTLPWWSILHYLNQAGAVLFLELCIKAEHMPTRVDELFKKVEKVMVWLAVLSEGSLSARSSLDIFRQLLVQAAAGFGRHSVLPDYGQQSEAGKYPDDQEFDQSLRTHNDQGLKMLRHSQQQAATFPGRAGELFSIGAEMATDPWLLRPTASLHARQRANSYTRQPTYQTTDGSAGWNESDEMMDGFAEIKR